MNELYRASDENLSGEENDTNDKENQIRLGLIIVSTVTVTLLIVLICLICCFRCKCRNRSLFSCFLRCLIGSQAFEARKNRYFEQFHSPLTKDETTEKTVETAQTLKRTSNKAIAPVRLTQKTLDSIGSGEQPKGHLKLPAAAYAERIRRALRIREEQEQGDRTMMATDDRTTMKGNLERHKQAMLDDDKVQIALKKIKNFAEKEKSRNRKQKKRNQETPDIDLPSQPPQPPQPLNDQESKLLEEFDMKKSNETQDQKRNRLRRESSARSFKVNERKRASTTIIKNTEKFEELNNNIRKILRKKPF